MGNLFHAPKSRPPLWAHPHQANRDTLSWKWAISAAIVIVGVGIYATANIDFTARSKLAEKQVLKVAMVTLAPEPKKEVPQKEETKPPEPPPKPKAPPKKIKKVVEAPPKAAEPTPEAAAVAMAPPEPGPRPEHAVRTPSAARRTSPPKNTRGGAGEVRQGVASLVACHPKYPSRAKQSGITGEFVVQMTVDPSGTVTGVKIVSGGPRAPFERDIKKSMSKCKFEPMSTGFIAEAAVVFRIEN